MPALRGRRSLISWLLVASVIGVAGAISIALSFLLRPSAADVPDTTSPVPASQDSLAAGARLYETNCRVCHGPDGRGGPRAPDLTLHIPIRTDGFLFTRISEGFPVESDEKTMPAYGNQLTETERWHLVNFLRETFRRRAPVLPEEMSQ